MKILKICYYIILLIVILFLPIFSEDAPGPRSYDLAIVAQKDSIYCSDSLKCVMLSKPFNSQSKEFQEFYKRQIDSLCKRHNYEIVPSIFRWTYYDLTGLGLIRKLIRISLSGESEKSYFGSTYRTWHILIPLLLLLSISIQIIILIKKWKNHIQKGHLLIILSHILFFILLFFVFPGSILYLPVFCIALAIEIWFYRKKNI